MRESATIEAVWSSVLVGAAFLAGCGRIAFSPTNDRGDGRTPDTPPATARTWIKRTPTVSPPKLNGVTLVPFRGAIVFYGSEDVADTPQSFMWSYANETWALVCSPCAPGPRESHALSHDPVRDVLVLFGGVINASQVLTNEVWEYDGLSWQSRAVSSPPPPLKYSTLVWYPPLQKHVLVGGESSANVASTTLYSYDGSDWRVESTAAPPSHSRSVSAVWDPASQRLIVFGGVTNGERDDAWSYDGSTWTQICATCSGQGRSVQSAVRDPGIGVLVVGGYREGTAVELAGTWRLAASELVLVDNDPPARDSAGLAYDAARDTIVLFGGNGDGCGGDHCDETWEYVPAN